MYLCLFHSDHDITCVHVEVEKILEDYLSMSVALGLRKIKMRKCPFPATVYQSLVLSFHLSKGRGVDPVARPDEVEDVPHVLSCRVARLMWQRQCLHLLFTSKGQGAWEHA